MTDALRPVVRLPPAPGDQLLNTGRRDRAQHQRSALPRADITRTLADEHTLTLEQVMVRGDLEKAEECAWRTGAA